MSIMGADCCDALGCREEARYRHATPMEPTYMNLCFRHRVAYEQLWMDWAVTNPAKP